MPIGLFADRPEHVVFRAYEDAPLQSGQVRIDVEFAAPKHGTEFHLFSGRSPFADRRFDNDLRMFMPREDAAETGPAQRFVGNMVVGRISAVGDGVNRFCVGDRVYAWGPIAQTATVAERGVFPMVDRVMVKSCG